MKAAGFDEKCGELARYFLPNGSEASIQSFASAIQDAVEDWLGDDTSRFLIDNEDSVPCPNCGSQDRDKWGLLRCECPDPNLALGAKR